MKRATAPALPFPSWRPPSLSACASTPVTSYRLASEPGPVEQVAPLTISVRRVSIPSYLDQGNVPMPVSPYDGRLIPQRALGRAFDDTLQTTMVEDLAQRLNGATVIDSNGSIEMPSDMQIEINLLRFDPSVTGDVELTMQVALKAGPTINCWGFRPSRARRPRRHRRRYRRRHERLMGLRC